MLAANLPAVMSNRPVKIMRRIPWSERIILISLLTLLTAAIGCTEMKESDGRPNVILIMTDDQGYGDFGVMGNPVIRTPNLDAMAYRSAAMTTFYVSPVCAPTRASLMTGRYNYRTRVVDTYKGRAMMDPAEVTIAEILGDHGYRTGIFGKWHLGDNYPMRPQDQGFDEVLVHRGGGIGQPSDPPAGKAKYSDPYLNHNGELKQFSGYITDILFDRAMEWIDMQEEEPSPFFAYIATNAPHGPFGDVPEMLLTEYQEMDLDNSVFPQDVGHPLPGENDQDRQARIYAMITNIDDNIGRLFDQLDRSGLTENTIVIFLNDNGPNGRRYTAGMNGRKTDVREGGIRSPLWMHWPGHLSNKNVSAVPAAHIDVAPTILDAVNIEAPTEIAFDGRSFLPYLTGSSQQLEEERHLVIQSHRGDKPQRYHHFMIRNDSWKMLHDSGFQREFFEGEPVFELYDMLADPLEQNDVADENPEVIKKLKAAYDEWFDDVAGIYEGIDGPLPISVGTAYETTTVLTRNDWTLTTKGGWSNYEATGVWTLQVEMDGEYDVKLLFPDPIERGSVTLTIDDQEFEYAPSSVTESHIFKSIPLQRGLIQIHAVIAEGNRTMGAWQIELSATM
mgnify:CR=1 FL=1